jgi:hypothetical protein
MQAILDELQDLGPLAEQYIQVLIAQELRENSKWVISNGGTLPIIDLSQTPEQLQPTGGLPTPTP